MCGIVGYIGREKAIPRVLCGLKFLEYRGYDSAGIAYIFNNNINIKKEVGRISELEKQVDTNINTNMCIGHTRWATHGEPTKINAHPHRSGKFTVVHNGIIENYLEIRNKLESEVIKFISDTDTESVCALLDYNYRNEKDIVKCIDMTIKELKGSFALGIICEDDIDNIYCTRCSSPLIIAEDDTGYYMASDVPAILSYTNKYYLLDDNDVVKLNKDKFMVYKNNLLINKEVNIYDGSREDAMLNGYDHYMLKEIHEEGRVFRDTYNYYVFDNEFKKTMVDFKEYNHIHIIACGSAYYVGLIGKNLIEDYADIPVHVEIASEYRYKKNFYDKDTLVIAISQSGETADTLAALRKAKEDGIDTLAIVNVVGSSLARESDRVLYTKAGPEIAVATTKAFLSQTTLISLIAIKLSKRYELLKEYDIDKYINELINKDYLEYAKKLYKFDNVLFTGRKNDYPLCLEGSLKLKETSYINSMAIESGELKHGTISLINEKFPVIGICTRDDIRSKTISNLEEIKARNGRILFITNEYIDNDFYEDIILIPKVHDIVSSILIVIPLQLIAYNVAKLRGCDIDKPRNLAKSVTVE